MSPKEFAGYTDQAGAAQQRYLDAEALQREERWLGAMYMMGYALECSLKAKLMQRHGQQTLMALEVELERVTNSEVDLFTHSLEYLIGLVDIDPQILASKQGQVIRNALSTCSSWSSEWRYDRRSGSESECENFMDAGKALLNFVRGSL